MWDLIKGKVKEAHLLIVKPWPERQPSNLTHSSRSLLEYSPEIETGSWAPFFHCPFATLQSTSISWKRALYVCGTLSSAVAAQRMPPACLALEARGSCVPGHVRLS